MFCNENDRPYRLEARSRDAAAMARVVARARARATGPSASTTCGTPSAPLAVAVATGAAFIREVMPGVYESDMGLWRPDPAAPAARAARARRRRRRGADERDARVRVAPRHPPGRRARALGRRLDARRRDPRLGADGRERARRSRPCARSCDAVAGSAPVLLNTGAKAANIAAFRPLVDGVIVGSRPQGRRRHLEPGRPRARPPLPGRRTRLTPPCCSASTSARPRSRPCCSTRSAACVGRASRPLANTSPAPVAGRRPTRDAWLANALGARAGGRARTRASTRRRSTGGGRRRAACRASCCSTRTTRRCARRCSTTTAAPTPRSPRCARRARRGARPGPHRRRRHAAVRRAEAALAGAPRAGASARARAAWPARTTGWPGGSPATGFSERNWALESGLYDLEARRLRRRPARRGGLGPRARSRRSATRPTWSAASRPSAAAATGLRAGTPRRGRHGRPRRLGVRRRARARTATCWSSSAAPVDVLAVLRPPAGRRAALPRRPSGARPVAAERLHGERRLGDPLVPARARRRRRRSDASTPRRPRRRPAPTALVMLPYLLGEKTPLNDPLAAGAIVGLGLGHTRGHLFRALLESFGHGVRHHLEVLAEHGIAAGAGARGERRRLVARSGSRSSPTSPASSWSRSSTTRARRSARPSPPAWARARSARGARSSASSSRGRSSTRIAATRDVHDARHAVYRDLYDAARAVLPRACAAWSQASRVTADLAAPLARRTAVVTGRGHRHRRGDRRGSSPGAARTSSRPTSTATPRHASQPSSAAWPGSSTSPTPPPATRPPAPSTRSDGIDVWCANAGISSMAPFMEISEEEYDANLAVNLKGVFLCGQAAARVMIAARPGGAIVNTASMAGKRGAAPYLAHYVASKFGVVGLTQAMAAELAPHRHPRQLRLPGLRRDGDAGARARAGRPTCAARRRTRCATCGWPTRRSRAWRRRRTSRWSSPSWPATTRGFVTGEALAVNGGAYMD